MLCQGFAFDLNEKGEGRPTAPAPAFREPKKSLFGDNYTHWGESALD
jgi:hypothetical protein